MHVYSLMVRWWGVKDLGRLTEDSEGSYIQLFPYTLNHLEAVI